MYFITREKTIERDPLEKIVVIERLGHDVFLLADIEENENAYELFGDIAYPDYLWRIAVYGGGWLFDKEELLNPNIDAIGELCGRTAGGITYEYETPDVWNEFENIYDFLFDYFYDAAEDVVVIEDVSELYELEEGHWITIWE